MSEPRRDADTLIFGRVVTMDPERRIIPDGGVAVVGTDIAAIGTAADIERSWTAPRRLGGADAIVIPGMIDAHSHCTQCFVRGLTVNELPMIPRIYAPAQRVLTAEQAGTAVRLMTAQLIRSGVTTLCEGSLNPLHEEATVATLREVGIRCVMSRGAGDQDSHHAPLYSQISDRSWVRTREGEAEKDLERTAAFLDRFPTSGRGLIRGAVNVSTLTAFSETYLRQATRLAAERNATLHVHIARDREEVELSMAVWKLRPVERLAALDGINERLVAIHAVLASPREIRMLGDGRANLAHCPVECVANLNAIPDVQQFRAAGCLVGLGCDIQANDMFTNMRAAWLLHGGMFGIARYDPEYLTPYEILEMTTCESARVLGISDRTGSLAVGKAADVVVMDGGAAHLLAIQDIVSELMRYGSRAEIRHVLVDGRLVLEDGVHTTIDLAALRGEVRDGAGAGAVRAAAVAGRYKPMP